MNYQQIFNNARDKFSKYEGHVTQDCRPEDTFDWWVAQEAWNAAIEAAANLVQDEMGEPDDTFWIVEKVRKLKK